MPHTKPHTQEQNIYVGFLKKTAGLKAQKAYKSKGGNGLGQAVFSQKRKNWYRYGKNDYKSHSVLNAGFLGKYVYPAEYNAGDKGRHHYNSNWV